MSRKRRGPNATAYLHRGAIKVIGPGEDIEFREPIWLFRVNQGFLLPGLRHRDKKVVVINGHKCGTAEHCGGAVPLSQYRKREEYFSDRIENIIAEVLGIRCKSRRRGYYRIKIRDNVFIVMVRRTEEQKYYCLLFDKANDDYIGDFMFDSTLSSVYTNLGDRSYESEFCAIVGYIMSSLLNTIIGRASTSLEINC